MAYTWAIETTKIINWLPSWVRNTDQDYTDHWRYFTTWAGIKFLDSTLKREFTLVQVFEVSSVSNLVLWETITWWTSWATATVVGVDNLELYINNVIWVFTSGETITWATYSATLVNIGSVSISWWKAVIESTRSTTSQFNPISNEKAYHNFTANVPSDPTYQLSHPIKALDVTGNKEIIIEIPLNNIEDQTLNTSTIGENIWIISSVSILPTHSNYIRLYSITWWDWSNAIDRREEFLLWNKIDLSNYDWDISANSIETDVLTVNDEANLPSNTSIDSIDIDDYIQNVVNSNVVAWSNVAIWVAWENFVQWEVWYFEAKPTQSELDTSFNVWETNIKLRYAWLHIGNGEVFSLNNLYLSKVWSPSIDIYVRIETDNAWQPSGTLVDPNATVTIVPASVPNDPTPWLVAINRPWSFSVTDWQVVRVVIGTNSYNAETFDASNYYKVFAWKTTTARTWLMFNWAIYENIELDLRATNAYVITQSNTQDIYWSIHKFWDYYYYTQWTTTVVKALASDITQTTTFNVGIIGWQSGLIDSSLVWNFLFVWNRTSWGTYEVRKFDLITETVVDTLTITGVSSSWVSVNYLVTNWTNIFFPRFDAFNYFIDFYDTDLNFVRSVNRWSTATYSLRYNDWFYYVTIVNWSNRDLQKIDINTDTVVWQIQIWTSSLNNRFRTPYVDSWFIYWSNGRDSVLKIQINPFLLTSTLLFTASSGIALSSSLWKIYNVLPASNTQIDTIDISTFTIDSWNTVFTWADRLNLGVINNWLFDLTWFPASWQLTWTWTKFLSVATWTEIDKITYFDWDWTHDIVIAKASAEDPYRNIDMWLSTQLTNSRWQLDMALALFGTNSISWLTDTWEYYLADTPWQLSKTPWTYRFIVGSYLWNDQFFFTWDRIKKPDITTVSSPAINNLAIPWTWSVFVTRVNHNLWRTAKRIELLANTTAAWWTVYTNWFYVQDTWEEICFVVWSETRFAWWISYADWTSTTNILIKVENNWPEWFDLFAETETTTSSTLTTFSNLLFTIYV